MELIEACLYSRTAVLKRDWDPFSIHNENRVSFSLNIVRHFTGWESCWSRDQPLSHRFSLSLPLCLPCRLFSCLLFMCCGFDS